MTEQSRADHPQQSTKQADQKKQIRIPNSGLVNEGSTCYLNSLIQTLFMTAQFRKNVYEYITHQSQQQTLEQKSQEEKQAILKKLTQKDKNSIPYQLQKLFYQLQTKDQPSYTKGLLKSFQWTEADALEQHDVQQFCRVLFEALEKSSVKQMKNNQATQTNGSWVSDLFEGVTNSFINCLENDAHVREKQEIFLDISLPLKNYHKSFESLDECLYEYLRPQKLEDKVDCEKCNERVKVEKGLKLQCLPKILTIQLSRFELNYETFQRQKINSFVYFPEVLYLGKFKNKHSEIELNHLPKGLKENIRITENESSSTYRNVNSYGDQYANAYASGKNADAKIKRKNSDEIEAKKEKVFYYEEGGDKREKESKELSKDEEKEKNRQILASLKSEQGFLSEKMKIVSMKKEGKISEQIPKQQPKDDDLEDDMLFGKGMGFLSAESDSPMQWNSGAFEKEQSVPNAAQNPPQSKKQEKQLVEAFQEEAFDPKKQYPESTYALYAVLVHSGGAYGGHYYAYIKDFHQNQWFKFDDRKVTPASRQQMRKYGRVGEVSGSAAKFSTGASAYMLFYRDVKTLKQKGSELCEDLNVNSIIVPQELVKKIEEDLINNKQSEEEMRKQGAKAEQRLKQINLGLVVKAVVIENDGSLVKKVPVSSNDKKNQSSSSTEKGGQEILQESFVVDDRFQFTIRDLKRKVVESFAQSLGLHSNQIQPKSENWRLRRYNKTDETMHEIYDGSSDMISLEQLGFRDVVHVALEVKKPSESFEEYDPKQITIKVNVWRSGLQLLTEKALKPLKITLSQQQPFNKLVQQVIKRTKIPTPIIVKRNFSHSTPILILNNTEHKTLIELRFFNGINLYVEEGAEGQPDYKKKWLNEFESEKYRCLIKYNNPFQGEDRNQEIIFDTRKTLKNFKENLGRLIGQQDIGEFRIKKSKQAVSELTSYNKKLTDLKFINNEFIFLEIGKSSKGSVLLKKGEVSIIDDKIEFNLKDEALIQIQSHMETVEHLLTELSETHKLPLEKIRIRQYKSYQFGEIYKPYEPIQKIKDKSLIWQQIPEAYTPQPKGLQIYIRVFDLIQFQLGVLKEIYVDCDSTYEELTYIIEEETGIQSDQVLCWKALSNYVEKSMLLDCEWTETRFIPKKMKEEPLFLNNDGDILIVKSAEKAYHPRVNYTTTSSLGGTKGTHGKETGVKITVVNEDEEDENKCEKQEETKGTDKDTSGSTSVSEKK